MSTTTTTTGRVRVACDYCPRTVRQTFTNPSGARIDLPAGWSVAPFPAVTLHPTGRRGDQHMCPGCDQRPRPLAPRYEQGYPGAARAAACSTRTALDVLEAGRLARLAPADPMLDQASDAQLVAAIIRRGAAPHVLDGLYAAGVSADLVAERWPQLVEAAS